MSQKPDPHPADDREATSQEADGRGAPAAPPSAGPNATPPSSGPNAAPAGTARPARPAPVCETCARQHPRQPQRPALAPQSGWAPRLPGLVKRPDFRAGLAGGMPIAFGYIAVSFAYGLFAAEGGLTPLTATLLSFSNLTSAGQFAGTQLIFANAPYIEIFVTVLLINLRYMLMSLSLSQKLRPGIGPLGRLAIGYGVTDEVYAVAALQAGEPGLAYMAGLILPPVIGWTAGTLLGALAGALLSASVRSALGIALYAMFVAIIIPPARAFRPVLMVVILAAGLSAAAQHLPGVRGIPAGWRLIAVTLIAALAGALVAPIAPEEAAPEEDATEEAP